MNRVERLLTVLCLGVSLLAGWAHLTQWLLITPVCFGSLLIAEDRALRHRMGGRTFPSEGYARFLLGSNLFLAIRNTLLSLALYAVGAGAGTLLRG